MSGLFEGLGPFSLRFAMPWALLLLGLVPWTIWAGARIRSLAAGRKWTAMAMRVAILLSLIAALAGAEIVKTNDRLAVFFVLDRSNSIPESARGAMEETVRTMCDAYMTARDEAGLIVFGEEPSIEFTVGPTLAFDQIQSFVGGEQSDLAAAVRLATAAFPQGYMRRIVLFTDGNETRGSAVEEIKLAHASGVEVDVVPVEIGGGNEVRVRELAAPSRVNTEEPFKLQVVVHADQDCEATLRLYQRTSEGTRMLPPTPVTLQKGDNAFVLSQELQTSGFYEYEAVVESPSDTVMANNEGRAFTVIHGEPKVLYLEADPEHSQRLGEALETEGLRVIRADFGSMPVSLAQLQNYDVVVLSNVSATDLTSDHLKALEAMVRDLGIGLVMVGGPDTFGAGGFFESAVERALPVSMDLKQRKVMPQGALVIILHTCEFADGNAWARDIALAALSQLSSQDLMGALAYDWQNGDSWLFELQLVGDKQAMRRALNTTQIGDMPSVEPTLREAYKALNACSASVKRVVMISDGDPGAPSGALLRAMGDASIAVSTICINPHSPNDQQMLQWVAAQTGGTFYYVTNPRNLPQIFMKEAAVVKRGMLIEEAFTPKPRYSSEILQGLSADSLPQLLGYVATTPKENATIALVSHEDDPVLAHWRYGLGKAVAFTSDVTNRWAPDWLAWDGFNRFWAQAVRWAVRDTAPSSFAVETRVKDGKGYVRIDAVDDLGRFVNFLRPEGIVTGPGPRFSRQELSLTQTGPGIYEGTFPLDERGVYMVNIVYTREDGSQGMIPTGLALNYSKEYEHNTTNFPHLDQMAALGKGRIMKPTDNPFEHNLKTTPSITPVWPYLATFAVCVFPVEIFVRRVMVDLRWLYLWVPLALRGLPYLRRFVPEPRTRRRQLTGAYGTMSAPSRSLVYTASGTFAPTTAASIEAIGQEPEPVEVVVAEKLKEVGREEYTKQLLAAKDRALGKRGRRGG